MSRDERERVDRMYRQGLELVVFGFRSQSVDSEQKRREGVFVRQVGFRNQVLIVYTFNIKGCKNGLNFRLYLLSIFFRIFENFYFGGSCLIILFFSWRNQGVKILCYFKLGNLERGRDFQGSIEWYWFSFGIIGIVLFLYLLIIWVLV